MWHNGPFTPVIGSKSTKNIHERQGMICAAQIRAARALLGLGQLQLSKLADVGITTVKRIEASQKIIGSARTLWKIQTALELAGVEFIRATDIKGPGVRLNKESERG
jgi:transcriptional regulator with XRE-family HTH domain